MGYINGYRQMWMLVMFDLPTLRDIDKKRAATFRKTLLDNGFEMSQFSVYLRFCPSREYCEKYVRVVKAAAPEEGCISILFFTDKQFSQSINIFKREIVKPPGIPEQLCLF